MYIEGVCYIHINPCCVIFVQMLFFQFRDLTKKNRFFEKILTLREIIFFYYLSWDDILPMIGNHSVYNERLLN